MKKNVLLISFLLIFASAYSQTQPAIQLENIKPGKNCFEDYYNAFATRGALPVPDGEHNVVISLRQNDSCICVEAKVSVQGGSIVPNVMVKMADGSYDPARRTLRSTTGKDDNSLGNVFSIHNGMSETFATEDYAVVNIFFVEYLKAPVQNVVEAPSPDQIVNTPKPVDPAKAAKEKEVLKKAYDGLKFKSGKATIESSSYQFLDLLVSMLKEKGTYQLALNGYTDNTGNAENNLKLSDDRANAVKNYLVKQGLNASNISAKGFGIENPIADNATAAGRAKNRRVDFILTEQK